MRGYALVIMAACMWAFIGPVAKYAFAAGMTPMEVALWRTAAAWLFFASQALFQGQTRVEFRDLPGVMGFGIVGIMGLFVSYAMAVEAGGAAVASVLLYTAPAWVALMSRMLLGEALTPVKILAVLMTVAGVAGVAGLGPGMASQGAIGPAALIFGLLSGVTYALYYIFGKFYGNRYSTPTLFLYAMPIGIGAMLFMLLREGHGLRLDHPLQAWLAVGFLGLVCTYLAYTVYYAGLKTLEATRGAVVATLEPLVAALLAYTLWGETFTPMGYIGASLIVGAVLLAVLAGSPRRQATDNAPIEPQIPRPASTQTAEIPVHKDN